MEPTGLTTTRVWGVGSEYCDPLWINHPFATFCQNWD